MTMKATINEPNKWHKDQRARWEMIADLRDGTDAMRLATTRWLPKEEGERAKRYRDRLARAVLFSAYDDTVTSLAGKPFAQSVTLENADGLDQRLTHIERNANRQGQDLTQFTADVMDGGVDNGVLHVYVEFPATGGKHSAKDEMDGKATPYFTIIRPQDLLDWETRTTEFGEAELMMIRVSEQRKEPDPKDVWQQRDVEYVRIVSAPGWTHPNGITYATGMVFLYRIDPDTGNEVLVDNDGQPTDDGMEHTYPGIPLTTFYTKRTGFMTGTPAMLDMAWANIEHWQANSDYAEIVHWGSVPMLYLAGADQKTMEGTVRIGPAQVFKFVNAQAKAGMVETSGRGAEVALNRLHAIEERMVRLGQAPLLQQTGRVTATASALDSNKMDTEIHFWISNLESVMTEAYRIAARWLNVDVPDDFRVKLFSEFSLTIQLKDDLAHLREMRKNGDLCRETYLAESKRRGVLSDSVDIDAEVEACDSEAEEKQAAALDMMEKRSAFGNDDDDDDKGDDDDDSFPPKKDDPKEDE